MMVLQYADLIAGFRIRDFDLQQKTVELGFRQRIRALKFNRVLGGKYSEEFSQRMSNAINADLALLHGLHQRCLWTRRHAIEFLRQQKIGKERPAMQRERAG